jgi:tungstate transport system ATP-binding protein
MSLYTLERIEQRYNSRTVLAIDQLEITTGGLHALIGPNGSGKTTLLDILAFLAPPYAGTLFFQGTRVDYTHGDMLALRRRVVLVDQHPIMFSTTVRSNLEFGLKVRRVDCKTRNRIVDEVLETVGLSRYIQARAHELSGGETQRLALARALALSPQVLLCDEPTASVDAENQAIIVDLLRRINQERGTTIVFTTHDRLQAAALAQHTLVLENGRLADIAYENSFGCTLELQVDGRLRCRLHGSIDLLLSADSNRPRQPTVGRVTIDPKKISLLRMGDQPPAANQFSGSVMLTMAEGDCIRVVVNVGVPMVVLLDKAAYHRQPPSIGATVLVVIPEQACTLAR